VLALTKCFDDEHEGEEADEEGVKFLESGEDAAVAFEPSEEAFDLIALGVEGAVQAPGRDAVGLGRHDRILLFTHLHVDPIYRNYMDIVLARFFHASHELLELFVHQLGI
jgi:hypothetical protein